MQRRRVVIQTNCQHAGKRSDAIQDLIQDMSCGRIHADHQDTIGTKARIDPLQAQEGIDQEARSDHRNRTERDLENHQPVHYPQMPPAAQRSSAARLHRLRQVQAREAQRR